MPERCRGVQQISQEWSWAPVILQGVEKQVGHGATQHSKWVHSSVVRAADCRSAGPWFKSGCALCFHDGLSLQGLRLMLTKRVEGMEWG